MWNPRTLQLILTALIFGLFGPVVRFDFINLDDNLYIYENPHIRDGLTWAGIRWAFTADLLYNSPNADFWQPLTILSHMMDVDLFGLRPAGHHLTNLVLHAINTILLFRLFHRMTGALWASAFLAAIFGVHPLRVESVAWVTARKDLLSTAFGLLSLIAYVRYAEHRRLRWYGLSLLCFVAGLMSKPMLVTMPALLLILDYWPLDRWRDAALSRTRLVVEKLPYAALAVASVTVSFIGQTNAFRQEPPGVFLAEVLVTYGWYLIKFVYPAGLAVVYPPSETYPLPAVICAAAALSAGTALVVLHMRRRPYLLAGWIWTLLALTPTLRLNMVDVADRYSYFSLIGIAICLAWGSSEILDKFLPRMYWRTVWAAVVIVPWCAVTAGYLPNWQSSSRLFEHALRVTSNNWTAHNNLGHVRLAEGRMDEAAAHFEAGLKINPHDPFLNANLAVVLAARGNREESFRHYQEALRGRPFDESIHTNIGIVLMEKGDLDAAIGHFKEALRMNPAHAPAHNNMGIALSLKGRYNEALIYFSEARRINPQSDEIRYNYEKLVNLLETRPNR